MVLCICILFHFGKTVVSIGWHVIFFLLFQKARADLAELKRIEKNADQIVQVKARNGVNASKVCWFLIRPNIVVLDMSCLVMFQSIKTEIAKLERAKMREELKKAKMMEELKKAEGRCTVGTCCESQEESVWSFIWENASEETNLIWCREWPSSSRFWCFWSYLAL